MIILHLILIGSCTLLPAAVAAQDDEPTTVYGRILQNTEGEFIGERAELPAERYAAGLYYDFRPQSLKPLEKHVDMAIRDEFWTLCEKMKKEAEDDPTKKEMLEIHPCNEGKNILLEIVKNTSTQRNLARDLQLITAGYEMSLDNYTAQPLNIIARGQSITQIWQATNDPLTSPFQNTNVRALPYPPEKRAAIKTKQEEIASELDELIFESDKSGVMKHDTTELTAAIYRYRHGYNAVWDTDGENCRTFNQDLEVNEDLYRKARWCKLEEKMDELRSLVTANINPPKHESEFIVFPSYVDEEKNYFVWIRADDVGLAWNTELEPMQPALYTPDPAHVIGAPFAVYDSEVHKECMEKIAITDQTTDIKTACPTIIRGGDYPKEITEPGIYEGVCSHPFTRQGYLCRPLETDACPNLPEGESTASDDHMGKILLTDCRTPDFKDDVLTRYMESGPNLCEVGGWRTTINTEEDVPDTGDKDPELLPNACTNCVIDLVCYSDDDEEQRNKNEGGKEVHISQGGYELSNITKPWLSNIPKQENGVIQVFIGDDVEAATPYQILWGLTMAQQMCNLPVGAPIFESFVTPTKGCARQYQAHSVMCNALAEDGWLQRHGLTVAECVDIAFVEVAQDEEICRRSDDPARETNRIKWREMFEDIAEQDADYSCAEMVEDLANLEPRAQAIKNSLPLSCTPECVSSFQNTIGNNLCYTGQCIEQSLEWNRTIPGRTAMTANDQSFAWDACASPDPQNGNLNVLPAAISPHLPPYRPQYFIQKIEEVLCQLNGLPVESPPLLCGFNVQRSLSRPLLDISETTENLVRQSGELDAPAQKLQHTFVGMGARLASDMYTTYLTSAARALTETIAIMSEAVLDITETSFPSNMCSRYEETGQCPPQEE